MSKPLVSIVLPTYNGEKYLAQAIESCLNQTYASLELIVVDDASTDRTPEIISSYATQDARMRCLRHNTNRKLPAALNTGFAQARGEYLTWTSDDNCYQPDAIMSMLKVLDSQPDASIVYSNYTVIDEHGKVRGTTITTPISGLATWNCVGACFLYRRAVYEELGGYSEDLYLAEDYDFWLRASIRFKFSKLEKDLYLYRDHSESLTRTKLERIALAVSTTRVRNIPSLPWISRTAKVSYLLNIARDCFGRGAPALTRRAILQIFRLSPLLAVKSTRWSVPAFVLGSKEAKTFRIFQSIRGLN